VRIPAPVANLRRARRFASKWIAVVGTELNDDFGRSFVPPQTRMNAGRLVRWAEGRLHAPTKKR
jgi:hypothetical protein